MKTIEIGEASNPLANYLKGVKDEPLVITEEGTPTAVILSLANADLETVSLEYEPRVPRPDRTITRADRRGRRGLLRRDASPRTACGLTWEAFGVAMTTTHVHRDFLFTIAYHPAAPAFSVDFPDLPEIITRRRDTHRGARQCVRGP